jgi:hypothetical protein
MTGFMTRSFGSHEAGSPVSVVMVGMVTCDLFRVLGSGPHLGRIFSEREEVDGAPLIVLTDGLWARQFHRAVDVVGRTLQLNEQPYEVVGILPPDFVCPAPAAPVDAYIPISHRDYGARGARPLQAVARLKPSATFATAQAELRAIGARLATAHPEDNVHGGPTRRSSTKLGKATCAGRCYCSRWRRCCCSRLCAPTS